MRCWASARKAILPLLRLAFTIGILAYLFKSGQTVGDLPVAKSEKMAGASFPKFAEVNSVKSSSKM
jgi:hypothetical protein